MDFPRLGKSIVYENSNVCEKCGYQSHPDSKGYRRKDGRSLSGPILAGD